MSLADNISMVGENTEFDNLVAPEVEVPKTVSAKAAFIAKCLHPPSAVSGFIGLPTDDTRSQVVAEYKGLVLMQAPGYLDLKGVLPPAKRPTSFAYLVTGGGARAQVISFFKDTDNGSWYQDLPNTILNKVYDVKGRMGLDVNLYRPAYKSLTTTLNTTVFNNTGMVAGCQFNPPLLWSGTALQLAEEKPSLFREFFKHLVHTKKAVPLSKSEFHSSWPKSLRDDMVDIVDVYINSLKATNKLGSLRISQTRPGRSDEDAYEQYQFVEPATNAMTVDLDPSVGIQFIHFGGSAAATGFPVPEFDAILNSDMRSATFPAKEGTFSVNRLNTPAPRWVTPTSGRNTVDKGSPSAMYQCWASWRNPDGNFKFIQFNDPAPLNTSYDAVGPLFDTQWTSDMTWSWIEYQGLSYNGNQDLVTIQQLVALKWILGLEMQPANQSSFAGMQKLSPRPDIHALEELMRDFYDMKSCLPSRYNFLGTLARGAAKLIPFAIKHAPKVLKALGSISEFDDDDKQRDHKTAPKAKDDPMFKMQRRQRQLKAAKKDIDLAEKSSGKTAKKFIEKAKQAESAAEKATKPRKRRHRKKGTMKAKAS